MIICWDLAFPEAFRELIAAGAKTIILPTFWTLADCSLKGLSYNPLSEKLFLESTLTARAYENTCAIIFVNAGAPPGDNNSTYAGLSRVAMPFVGALGDETKDTSQEGMSIVSVDMEMVEEAERNCECLYLYLHDVSQWGRYSVIAHCKFSDIRHRFV